MSQYLESLTVGDTVDVRGPSGKVTYLGRGYLRVKLPGKPEQIRHCTQLGLIAGGTGITPMLQIIMAVLKDKEDTTKLFLLFANQVCRWECLLNVFIFSDRQRKIFYCVLS